jgi:ABC-type taurine transport system ATPase subunit
MADASKRKMGMARAVFSDAARDCLLETDQPIEAVDAATRCRLSYRVEAVVGGVLRIHDGTLGGKVLAVASDPDDLNLVATLLLDGLAQRRQSLPTP